MELIIKVGFETLYPYVKLARVDKPVGYFLLMAPVLWALWLSANGVPRLNTLLIFIAGVFLMRSAGCVANDYMDRDIDRLVARTRNRPLASGELSPPQAVVFFIVLVAIAFMLVLLTNWWTVLMSSVALVLAITYPLMKRFHHLPQLHLGLAFGWAIPMAWTAETGTPTAPLSIWILYAANIMWVLAYDTIYALTDRDDDIKAGIKSSAILFGRYDRVIIGLLQLGTLGLLATIGYLHQLGVFYYLGIAIAAGLFVCQQSLIKEYDKGACMRAFSNNGWVGLIIFAGLAADMGIISG